MKKTQNKAYKFIKKMAKMETGCGPSIGFMDQLVLEAREAIKEFDNNELNHTQMKRNQNKAYKFIEKMAKMETGCGRSVGFMDELVIDAREAIKEFDNNEITK